MQREARERYVVQKAAEDAVRAADSAAGMRTDSERSEAESIEGAPLAIESTLDSQMGAEAPEEEASMELLEAHTRCEEAHGDERGNGSAEEARPMESEECCIKIVPDAPQLEDMDHASIAAAVRRYRFDFSKAAEALGVGLQACREAWSHIDRIENQKMMHHRQCAVRLGLELLQ